MAYGDYSGPDKPNKGKEGGACNRTLCQAEPARWYNHGSLSWYCDDCKHDIGEDDFNARDWLLNLQPSCGHPMFETREQIDARQADEAVLQHARDTGDLSPMVKRMEAYMGLTLNDDAPDPTEYASGKRERTAPRPRDLYRKGRRQ